MNVTRLLSRKGELQTSQVQTQAIAPLTDGQAVFAIRRVALTTNNITYAAFGEAMQYWNFFPTDQAQWGHMPVWGFADVSASTVQGVEVGERFYGYWPIATHLCMQPVRATQRGFYDGADHRLKLTSAYNQYTRCSTDPEYRLQDEALQMLLRPLFITSFMLADFLQENALFGATKLIVSSASSKTAYGTAFCLPGVDMIALTSPRNRTFVQGLGCYSRCVTYGELERLPIGEKVLYVDFSGDETLRARIHRHFGDALVYDCYAGSAQNTNFLRDTALPGPRPVIYFAPVQIRKRNTDWGAAVVNQRFGDAQRAFFRHVGEAGWLKVVEHEGFTAAQQLIAELAAGNADPQLGHIVALP
jgi:Protein of unknown function (DUF2855)